jgi:hypothetical protein
MSNIIQNRIEKVNIAMNAVKEHCMCLKIIDDGKYFIVIYPIGDFETDGCRCDYSYKGKTWALEKLIEVMERHWKNSYPSC